MSTNLNGGGATNLDALAVAGAADFGTDTSDLGSIIALYEG